MLEHVNIALKTGGPVFCNAGRRSWVDTNFHGESPRRNGKEGDGRGGNEVQVHVSANRLTMRDMGGTHITYLSFMLISIVFWLLGTETPQGRKLIVPFLHRQSSLLALQQSKVLHLP